MEGNSNKVKVIDLDRIISYRSIFDQKLIEAHSEMTKEDIKKLFLPYFEKGSEEIEVFTKLIDNIKEEFFEKLKKKLKSQYKQLNKTVVKYTEEEKSTKESETKIIKEDKIITLEKENSEKANSTKNLLFKQKETKNNLNQFYSNKADSILFKYNLNSQQIVGEDNIIITKKDESNSVHQCSLVDVCDYFASTRVKIAKELVNQSFILYNETQMMQKQLIDDYSEMEKIFLSQQNNLEVLKNMKNKKEKSLIKSNLLF